MTTTTALLHPVRQPLAHSATPMPFFVDPCVRVVERVSVDAVRLAGIDRWQPAASEHVLPRGDWLKMSRVAAPLVPTEVVDYQSNRDWPNGEFVSHPVCEQMARASRSSTNHPVNAAAASPGPALVGTSTVNLGPESVR